MGMHGIWAVFVRLNANVLFFVHALRNMPVRILHRCVWILCVIDTGPSSTAGTYIHSYSSYRLNK